MSFGGILHSCKFNYGKPRKTPLYIVLYCIAFIKSYSVMLDLMLNVKKLIFLYASLIISSIKVSISFYNNFEWVVHANNSAPVDISHIFKEIDGLIADTLMGYSVYTTLISFCVTLNYSWQKKICYVHWRLNNE